MGVNEDSQFSYKRISELIESLTPVRDEQFNTIIFDLSEICNDLTLTIHRDGKWLIFSLRKGEEQKNLKVPVRFFREEGMVTGGFVREFEQALKDFGVELDRVELEKLVSKAEQEIFKNQDILLKGDDLKRFEVKTLAEIISEAKPVEFLVDGLIPKRSLVVLAGKGGVGKSTVVLKLIDDLFSGGEVFGEFRGNGVERVLVVDEENYPSFYKQRREILGLNDDESLSRIDCCVLQGVKIDTEDGLQFLREKLAEKRYDLVILDSLSNLLAEADENKSHEITRILNGLRRIAYEYDTTFILIHHLRKGLAYAVEDLDEVRGSTALVNEPDVVFVLQKNKVTGSVIVKNVKNRFSEPINFVLSFKNVDGQLSIEFSGFVSAVEEEDEVVKCMKCITDILATKRRAVKREELLKELEFSKSTIDRALERLVKDGVVERVKKGFYRLKQSSITQFSDTQDEGDEEKNADFNNKNNKIEKEGISQISQVYYIDEKSEKLRNSEMNNKNNKIESKEKIVFRVDELSEKDLKEIVEKSKEEDDENGGA